MGPNGPNPAGCQRFGSTVARPPMGGATIPPTSPWPSWRYLPRLLPKSRKWWKLQVMALLHPSKSPSGPPQNVESRWSSENEPDPITIIIKTDPEKVISPHYASCHRGRHWPRSHRKKLHCVCVRWLVVETVRLLDFVLTRPLGAHIHQKMATIGGFAFCARRDCFIPPIEVLHSPRMDQVASGRAPVVFYRPEGRGPWLKKTVTDNWLKGGDSDVDGVYEWRRYSFFAVKSMPKRPSDEEDRRSTPSGSSYSCRSLPRRLRLGLDFGQWRA